MREAAMIALPATMVVPVPNRLMILADVSPERIMPPEMIMEMMPAFPMDT